jgi:MEDS: MEthanogen/methylotroph, DcmR Sensory domain
MPVDFRTLEQSVLASSSRRAGLRGRHFVQFYDDDSSLVGAVGTFLTLGLGTRDAAIAIAAPDHRAAIEKVVSAAGVDLAASQARGEYLPLDAEEALSSFMVDGMPDAAKFNDSIGSVVAKLAGGRRNVRIFGEMVAILWDRGNIAAAIALEELWNSLSRDIPFKLFCAYPTSTFDRSDLPQLERVCGEHTQVIPPAMQAHN